MSYVTQGRHGSVGSHAFSLLMTEGYVHLLYNSSWKLYQLAAGQLKVHT
jgi:hypothetical protein